MTNLIILPNEASITSAIYRVIQLACDENDANAQAAIDWLFKLSRILSAKADNAMNDMADFIAAQAIAAIHHRRRAKEQLASD
jgi:hypothetical protein